MAGTKLNLHGVNRSLVMRIRPNDYNNLKFDVKHFTRRNEFKAGRQIVTSLHINDAEYFGITYFQNVFTAHNNIHKASRHMQKDIH